MTVLQKRLTLIEEERILIDDHVVVVDVALPFFENKITSFLRVTTLWAFLRARGTKLSGAELT